MFLLKMANESKLNVKLKKWYSCLCSTEHTYVYFTNNFCYRKQLYTLYISHTGGMAWWVSKMLHLLFNLCPQLLQLGVHMSCLYQIHLLLQLPASSKKQSLIIKWKKTFLFTVFKIRADFLQVWVKTCHVTSSQHRLPICVAYHVCRTWVQLSKSK